MFCAHPGAIHFSHRGGGGKSGNVPMETTVVSLESLFFFPSPGPETISTGTNGNVSSAILLDQGEYLITY